MHWMVDFFDTDQSYHVFCPSCFEEIPKWLMRYATECGSTECDGCARKEVYGGLRK